jgi:hypothetical protein
MSAMYQQIATFGKMTPIAYPRKPPKKSNYQNDMDTFAGKFIYRYGQRNALPGYAAFS